ncbi:MAG: invasion associated locus B family protein [Pseudomonadota bacterium]
MKTQIACWMICLGLLTGAPAFAQTDTTTEETTTTEEPAAEETATEETDAADAETDASTESDEQFPVAGEQPEPGEPQPGDGYLKTKFESWEVRCIKAEEGEVENCNLYVLLNDEDGASVAEFNVTALPAGGKAAAGVDIATPLGSLLTKQVLMKIGTGKTNRYPYTWCDQLACIARFGLTAQQIDAMKRGISAEITVYSIAAPDEAIKLTLSLKGFTAAWNEVAK